MLTCALARARAARPSPTRNSPPGPRHPQALRSPSDAASCLLPRCPCRACRAVLVGAAQQCRRNGLLANGKYRARSGWRGRADAAARRSADARAAGPGRCPAASRQFDAPTLRASLARGSRWLRRPVRGARRCMPHCRASDGRRARSRARASPTPPLARARPETPARWHPPTQRPSDPAPAPVPVRTAPAPRARSPRLRPSCRGRRT